MAIRVQEPPERIQAAVKAGLAETAVAPPGTSPAPIGQAQALAPVPTFFLDRHDLAEGWGVEKAWLGSWRVLVCRDISVVRAVDVVTRQGKQPAWASVCLGPFDHEVKALERADEFAATQSRSCWLRYLQIPSLYVSTVWLKPEADDGGWVWPFRGIPCLLPDGEKIPAAEMCKRLIELARQAAPREPAVPASR